VGRGELLREGSDVVLIAIGSTVSPSLKAAQELSYLRGIDCAVVDARFVKPLDSTLILKMARKIKQSLVIEENTVCGGLGSAVLQLLQREGVWEAQVRCVGIPDTFVEHGSQQALRAQYHLDAAGIEEETLKLLSETRGDIACFDTTYPVVRKAAPLSSSP
jgi:1-deoxy-D-xylulose-5-phosphate synthase